VAVGQGKDRSKRADKESKPEAAKIGVTAYVHESDVAALDERLEVTDADWNDHYAEVWDPFPSRFPSRRV